MSHRLGCLLATVGHCTASAADRLGRGPRVRPMSVRVALTRAICRIFLFSGHVGLTEAIVCRLSGIQPLFTRASAAVHKGGGDGHDCLNEPNVPRPEESR
jgi:hypothetical protein